MRTLKQYWQHLSASIKQSLNPHAHPSPMTEEFERDVSAIRSANQTLAANVGQVRTDLERTRSEESLKITVLEQARQEIEAARGKDQHKLAELERVTHTLETARQEESKRVTGLAQRLAEIESERNQARDQVEALETALAETSTQLEKTDNQVKALQAGTMEQAREFEASLSHANTRLESTDKLVKQLAGEQRLYEKTSLETQTRLRTQDQRLSWTMMVAIIALVLATVAGAILIWDVQKNARILVSMSNDMKHLMASMDEHLDTQHQAQAGQQTPPPRVIADARAPEKEIPVASEAAKAEPPTLPEEMGAPVSQSTVNPYLGRSLDRNHKQGLQGIRQLSREQAKTMFDKGATSQETIGLPGGLQYRVVKAGRGRSPTVADRVMVDYIGVTPDGTVFDDTYSSGQPATFHMSELVPGWRETLLKMEEGAHWEVTVPADLMAGGNNRKRGIPGSEPGMYLIELLEIIETNTPD